jgi:hypothetical protein
LAPTPSFPYQLSQNLRYLYLCLYSLCVANTTCQIKPTAEENGEKQGDSKKGWASSKFFPLQTTLDFNAVLGHLFVYQLGAQ